MHVPFCVHKCHYCDFYSIVDTQDRMDAFCDRLILELRSLAPHTHALPLHTIFVGGGTPSLLGPHRWTRLLGALADSFDLSLMGSPDRPADPFPPGEFTVECNPESATPDLFHVLAAGRVNRVSLGAQSFQPDHLKTLERRHDPDNVPRALLAARHARITRQSLDLIYAIPGQSIDHWLADLHHALALNTSHISCYNLTYEPGTAMTHRLRAGQFTPIDEDTEIQMFLHTRRALRDAGLVPYELSNFAATDPLGNSLGAECRHNLAYWRQQQWLAAGPSASGHLFASHDPLAGGWRWKNVPRLGDYLADDPPPLHPWFSPVADAESPDPRRALRERIMTGLRLREGLDRLQLLRDAGRLSPPARHSSLPLDQRLLARAKPYEDRGLLLRDADRWVLSEHALLRADGIAADLMRALP